MYTNDYNKALERMKTTMDLIDDLHRYERCNQMLQHYDRLDAWNCLQDMIHEYSDQIQICGSLEGIQLYADILLAQVSDQELRAQLVYVRQRIPAYVLVREGQEKLAKKICAWLNNIN